MSGRLHNALGLNKKNLVKKQTKKAVGKIKKLNKMKMRIKRNIKHKLTLDELDQKMKGWRTKQE